MTVLGISQRNFCGQHSVNGGSQCSPRSNQNTQSILVQPPLPAYTVALAEARAGTVVPVFVLPTPTDPLRSKYAVVQVFDRQETGEYRYEDVKDMLRGQLGEQMAIRRYLDRLRGASYVAVMAP